MINVLVVEDDRVLADAHRRYVERVSGFVVSGVVHTGRAALAHLADHRVDLILLDIYLPDTDGIELCRQLRQHQLHVDVIAVTSAQDVDIVRSAVSLGVLQYLIKPFTFARFREKLERYADYRQRLSSGSGAVAAQEDVDRALTTLRGSSDAPLPKGFSRDTWEAVIRELRAHESDASAEELATTLGIARVTARRYLEYLVDNGLAMRSLRYGRAGRPQQRYRSAR